MKHPKPEEWVPFLFGETEPGASRDLKAHLAQCNECRHEIEAWRGSMRRLDHWKLPAKRRALPAVQPILKVALAALVVFAFAVGLGLGYGISARSSGSLRAQTEASLKASLLADLRSQWRADFQSGLALTQEDMRAATDQIENRLATARQEDRQLLKLLLQDQQSRLASEALSLRRDLETVAALTDTEIRSTRYQLGQLTAATAPGAK